MLLMNLVFKRIDSPVGPLNVSLAFAGTPFQTRVWPS
jgi:hypothetical protein